MTRERENVFRRPAINPVEGPEVVVLIGSTRFQDHYREVTRRLTLEGKIVVSVGLFGHEEGLDMEGPYKHFLDALHFCKINQGHSVYLINPEGYVGQSTARELVYAALTRKKIYHMEMLPDWFIKMHEDGLFHA